MRTILFLVLLVASAAAVCVDLSNDCPSLKNLCDDENVKELLKKKCPKTCGVCACEDDASVDCTAMSYLCSDKQYVDYTKLHCPKTCGYCRECTDNDDTCPQKASMGMCTDSTTIITMAKACPLSCGYCQYLECEDLELECDEMKSFCNESTLQDKCRQTCKICYDWQRHSDSGYWYKVLTNTGSWEYLENICEGVSGHLASIHSSAENNFIFNILATILPGGKPWLGLRFDGSAGTWSDETQVNYTNYFGAPSNNACYAMLESTHANGGQWTYADCNEPFYGICKKTTHNS